MRKKWGVSSYHSCDPANQVGGTSRVCARLGANRARSSALAVLREIDVDGGEQNDAFDDLLPENADAED